MTPDPKIGETSLPTVVEQLNLRGPYPQAEYVSKMEQRFGSKGARFMDEVDRRLGSEVDPSGWARLYRLKSSDHEMSVYVTEHQYSALYRAFLTWLVKSEYVQAPQHVLDLGCDVGLLTLAVAKLYPDAEVTGVDSVGSAIAAAKKQRKRHQVENATFVKADLTQPACMKSTTGDLLVATWLLHELLPSTLTGSQLNETETQVLTNLSDCALSGALLVTANRMPFPERQTDRLVAALRDFQFSLEQEATINAAEGGKISKFPVLCFRKN